MVLTMNLRDDHSAKAISAYGHGLNDTPNLDRIANEGMRFDDCYVTNSSASSNNVYGRMCL